MSRRRRSMPGAALASHLCGIHTVLRNARPDSGPAARRPIKASFTSPVARNAWTSAHAVTGAITPSQTRVSEIRRKAGARPVSHPSSGDSL
jgi:hypothetical protein